MEGHERDVVNWRSRVPVYRQIAEFLRRRIAHLEPDAPVPSEKEIMDAYGVGRHTARAAIKVLRDEGLIETVPHRGSFKVGPDTDGSDPDRPGRDR
jgi:GntR family transcriptional regulator